MSLKLSPDASDVDYDDSVEPHSGHEHVQGALDFLKGLASEPGPSGPAGPQGEPGPEGPQGIQGETGATGATGPQGPEGPQGDIGATGAQGEIGATGAVGSEGPQGEQGPQGDTGPAGATGPQGEPGPTGATGATGAAGAAGPEGPQGEQGEIGPEGPQGATGAMGPQGPQGEEGSLGVGIYNVLDYGAVGAQAETTGTIAASSTSLTVATGTGANFPIGSYLKVTDAGATGKSLLSKITGRSGDVITLQTAASASVTDATVCLFEIKSSGDMTASGTTITLADATGFPVGCHIYITGAGGGISSLFTEVVGNDGTTLTLADPAVVTVTNADVGLDNSFAFNAAHKASRSDSGVIYVPGGYWSIAQVLDFAYDLGIGHGSHAVMRGAGRRTKIVCNVGPSSNLINLNIDQSQITSFTFEDMIFLSGSIAPKSCYNMITVAASTSGPVVFRDVGIYNMQIDRSILHFAGGGYPVFENVTMGACSSQIAPTIQFRRCTNARIRILESIANVVLDGVAYTANDSPQFFLYAHPYELTYPNQVTDSMYVDINGLYVGQQHKGGIQLDNSLSDVRWANVVVRNAWLRMSSTTGGVGMSFAQCDNVLVEGGFIGYTDKIATGVELIDAGAVVIRGLNCDTGEFPGAGPTKITVDADTASLVLDNVNFLTLDASCPVELIDKLPLQWTLSSNQLGVYFTTAGIRHRIRETETDLTAHTFVKRGTAAAAVRQLEAADPFDTGPVRIAYSAPTHATGSMLGIHPSLINNGNAFTLSDGTNTPITFEFRKTGSPSGGNVLVDISTATTNTDVATAIAAAVNGATGGSFTIGATVAIALVTLDNSEWGSAGNITITNSGCDPLMAFRGMYGGGEHVPVAEMVGQIVPIWSDATAIAFGDNIKPSSAADGRATTLAGTGTSGGVADQAAAGGGGEVLFNLLVCKEEV